MLAIVSKWGNSLGVRLPKRIVDENKISEGVELEIQSKDGVIVLIPKISGKYQLSDLIDGINETNLHGETSTGSIKGNETW